MAIKFKNPLTSQFVEIPIPRYLRDLVGDSTHRTVSDTEKQTWNEKQESLEEQIAYTSKGSATKVPQITTNTLGQVTNITEVDIKGGGGGISALDVYPIGSIYMSINDTSPSILFGGTWEQIQDTFLLSAGSTYNAGDVGGESTHTLIVDEMPTHTHTQNAHSHTGQYATGVGSVVHLIPRTNSSWGGAGTNNVVSGTIATNNNTGGGLAHNNMPPYLVVYMWKRIA